MSIRLALLALCLVSGAASAHELGTAVFHVAPVDAAAGHWQVRMELPAGLRGLAARPGLEPGPDCQRQERRSWIVEQRRVLTWDWRCADAWNGRRLQVTGLSPQLPDALIHIRLPTVGEQYHAVNLRAPAVTLPDRPVPPAVPAYFGHGLAHIASGWDHLLFVILLFWGCRGARLIWAVTGFTAAHALSLGGVLLAGWTLPAAPVETLIALSLSLLAAELLRHPGRALRRPALLAFGFGLLHGLGFAGALRELGLPEQARWQALALFNLGIEAGQLLLIGLLLAGGALLRRLRQLPDLRAPAQYLIGVTGVYWALGRYSSLFLS